MLNKKIKKKLINIYLSKYVDKLDNKKKIISNNNNSKYYIIASNKKRGFFSLLLFVLNHLKYSHKNKLLPLIDMKYHPTLYNENKIIFGTKNCWEYYFKKINNLNVDKIYNRNEFKLCEDKNLLTRNNQFNPSLKSVFKKYVKINDRIIKKYNLYKKKFFQKNNNIIGIHFRGTDMKYTPSHPFPLSKKQVFYKTKILMKKYKLNKIFLVTEDMSNFNFIIKKFGKKNVLHINNFKSYKTKVFDLKYRKLHKYKMGEEALINSLILSNCNVVLSTQTGISDFARFYNPNLKLFKIDNGFNSNKILFALFKFNLKSLLPSFLGGFKI